MAPAALSGHFCIDIPGLDPIRAAVETPLLQAMVPTSAKDFIEAQLEGDSPPPVLHNVDVGSRVCGLALNQDDPIFAVRVNLPSPHPYGTWHSGARHFGNVVVFGERSSVDDAGAYLAVVLFEEDADAPISIHIADGVASDIMRPLLTESLRETSTAARDAARAEEEARESAPDYGDPQAFIRVMERRVRGLLEWVPDVGEVTIEVSATGGALDVDITADIHGDSPLSTELEGAPMREGIFDGLPRGTAFAFSREDEGESVLGALVEIAGARASTDEAAGLLGLADQMPAPFTFALGVSASPWLVYSGAAPSGDTIRQVLARPYARTLTSALFDCPRPPRTWPLRGDAAPRRCRIPTLDIGGASIALGTAPPEVVGASPDIARLLADSRPALGGLYVDVLRLPAALSLFTALEERELTQDVAAPIVGTLDYDAETRSLHGRIRCAPGSIAHVSDVAMSLAD